MKKNNKGFSLIELSIVLIIMGLLIAGVTGGASLIKSAQLRSIVTEFTNYRTAFNTYYAQFGKVPGASDTDGNVIDTANDATGALSALFAEGIIDREPTDGAVASKFGKGAKWYLTNAGDSYVASDFSNLNVLIFSGAQDFITPVLTNREAQSIDEKVDDGKSKSGLVRGVQKTAEGGNAVTNSDYVEDTIETAKKWGFVSKMDF